MNSTSPILQQFKTKEEQDKFFNQYLPKTKTESTEFVRTLKSQYNKNMNRLTVFRKIIFISSAVGLVCALFTIFGCIGSYDLGVETQETQTLLITSLISSAIEVGLIAFSETYLLNKVNEIVRKYNYCLDLLDTLETIKK